MTCPRIHETLAIEIFFLETSKMSQGGRLGGKGQLMGPSDHIRIGQKWRTKRDRYAVAMCGGETYYRISTNPEVSEVIFCFC